MTTSGVNTFSVNRDDIIRMAMLNIEKLAGDEVPTAQEISDCAVWLNMLVKQWQGTADFAPGLKTWTRRHGHLFLQNNNYKYLLGPGGTGWTETFVQTTSSSAAAAGQAVVNVTSATGMLAGDHFGVILTTGNYFWSTISTVVGTVVTLTTNVPTGGAASGATVVDYTTIANQPIVIETGFLRDSTNSDTPLDSLTQPEYDNLPSKTDSTNLSDPSSYYYEFQLTNGNFFTDVAGAQDVTKHICLTYLEAEQDFVNPTDTPEYPQEWYLPLALHLSKLICPMFRATWTPLHAENAALALAIAQRKEPQKTVAYFQCGTD